MVFLVTACLLPRATVVCAAEESTCTSSDCHQEFSSMLGERVEGEAEEGGAWANPHGYLHGPLRDGKCSPCHPTHAKGEPPSSMLHGRIPAGSYATYSRAQYSACFKSCHEPTLVEEQKTSTATAFRNGDDNLHYRHVAKPRRGRSCRLCHAVHSASNAALISDFMPFGQQRLTLRFEETENGGKCATSCHVPVEYSRHEAIESPMRLADPQEKSEVR